MKIRKSLSEYLAIVCYALIITFWSSVAGSSLSCSILVDKDERSIEQNEVEKEGQVLKNMFKSRAAYVFSGK